MFDWYFCFLFQSIFGKIFQRRRVPGSDLQRVVNKTLETEISMRKNFLAKHPNMSLMNAALGFKDIQEAVWRLFNFDMSCPLPVFDSVLLYGALSTILHEPGFNSLCYSNEAPKEIKCFFASLGNYYKMEVKEYNEIAASSYEEKLY